MKKFSIIVLLFSLIFIFAPNASALNSAVYFEGRADNFVFYPGSEWNETDLFDGFKSAMPGDKLTETVKVRNTAPEYDYVKIYLRAEAHDESANPLSNPVAETETVATMSDFLAQLTMRIYNGGELVYNATPDQTDGLSSNVLLGEFVEGAGATLTIELEVPKTLGNEYMHRSGEVDWIFTAEGYVDDKPCNCPSCCCQNCESGSNTQPEQLPDGTGQNTNSPFTFDNIVGYALILVLSLLGLIASAIVVRKLKQQTNLKNE